MRSYPRPLIGLVIWMLLSLWLSLGGLAWAEQLNLLAETGSQDEEALLQLAATLKPDVPVLEGPLTSAVNDPAGTPSLPILSISVSPPALIPVDNLTALRLHQRLSVYRI